MKATNMLEKAEAMKLRTKQFAIRVVGVVRSLPRTRVRATLWANNCFAAVQQLRLITGRFVELGPMLSLFPR